jgi:hypothetical protein
MVLDPAGSVLVVNVAWLFSTGAVPIVVGPLLKVMVPVGLSESVSSTEAVKIICLPRMLGFSELETWTFDTLTETPITSMADSLAQKL